MLQPYISECFDSPIWKFIIDSESGLLFVEVRDAETREVSFASINLKNGHTNFKKLTQPEKWLIGLEACFNGTLFLHGYESAHSPAHKGITAINGITGTEIWNNYGYAIHHISINGPVAYNTQIQPQKLFIIDEKTGSTLRNYDAGIDLPLQQNIKVPNIITQVNQDITPFIKGQIMGNIHYLEYNSFRIVSLHSLNQDVLQQILLIIKDGNLVFEDLLNDRIQKLQPEAFIMHQTQLIVIKNKIELKIFNLLPDA